MRPPLVLASASPRREALLRQIAVIPDEILAPEIDESRAGDELPRAHAMRLAREKALKISNLRPDAAILAADTVVAIGRRILPKADDAKTAAGCLERLSGRRHRVVTAVALRLPDGRLIERAPVAIVAMKRLDAREIADYLASEEWRGKAGGYAIQGRAAAFIRHIGGSWSNIVGLPLYETAQMLAGAGLMPSGRT
ncbi:MAG: Maf family nucleotide pyrophosphatase [Rhodothalassiaceae bacterium]